jgi:hypothetical protein
MSLSNPKLQNPAKKFIEFKGDKGTFQYFDKELGEKGETVEFKMPFYFIVLDELSTITGYNEKNECGIYSNEIHSLNDEIFKVKTFKGGISIVGKYADIKNDIKAIGGKFTKSIYAMLLGKPNEFVHFKFSGSAFGSWLEKKIDLQKAAILVNETAQGEKGTVKFIYPLFKQAVIPTTKQYIWDAALEMDKQLQKYLISYKNNQIEKTVVVDENSQVIENESEGTDSDWEELQRIKNAAVNSEVKTDDLPF